MNGGDRGSWIVFSRELLADLIDLGEAEVAAARAEIARGLKPLVPALIALLVGLFLGFWVLALVAYALVEVTALWLPRWGAALAVTGLYAVATLIAGLLGWRRLKRLENPLNVAHARLRDHLDWWRREVALHPPPAGLGGGGFDSGGRSPAPDPEGGRR